MGISSMPTPSEGMLCVLLVNTALSFSIVKGIIRAIVSVISAVGLCQSSFSDSDLALSDADLKDMCPEEYRIEEFHKRYPAVKYGTLCRHENNTTTEPECSVCLNHFEPESKINLLSCGHLFHKVCLKKWLDYQNFTCPLCRKPLIPGFKVEDDAVSF